ncbi:MAG: primosomal protein N' [Planctomycetota bacterium]|nr:primosomal protein N' [Planctomycetota bacterium]
MSAGHPQGDGQGTLDIGYEKFPLVRVAIPRPVRKTFDYRVPASLSGQIAPGQRVRCPFGRTDEVGFVVSLIRTSDCPESKLKELRGLVDLEPKIGPGILELTRWMADYYGASWGEALSASLPSAVGKSSKPRFTQVVRLAEKIVREQWMETHAKRRPAQRRVLEFLNSEGDGFTPSEITRRTGAHSGAVRALVAQGILRLERVGSFLEDSHVQDPGRHELTADQSGAIETITRSVCGELFEAFLLWGVTGSGKTEVYMKSIESVVAQGRQAIVLVPEISLTPQTWSRFRARFSRVALLHSQQTEARRREGWERIQSGEIDVVVGPRSAVFAPVPRLGMIVVDEEHETSFKQNTSPRYHARDVALVRAQAAGAVVVLGSATPSLEAFRASETGKSRLLRLPNRVTTRPLPEVTVINMTSEAGMGRGKGPRLFSGLLERAIREAIGRGEQAVLFLNRRGFSTFLVCRRCGYVLVCPNCNVTLTHHKKTRRVICHHCLHEGPPPNVCPECLTGQVRYRGLGTEKIEEVVQALFPGIRMARMDSDTMTDRGAYERVLGAFGSGQIDILIGTQMIAKGLDFPRVTVVGVINADTLISLPDFRSAERTFQLITQVAGRAGRGERPGRVYVQSLHPDHYAIRCASHHDYEAFCREEMGHRYSLGYPPYTRLIRIVVSSPEVESARERAELIAVRVREVFLEGEVLLGPVECPLARIQNRWRFHLLVKGPDPSIVSRVHRAVNPGEWSRGKDMVTIDVDPLSLL